MANSDSHIAHGAWGNRGLAVLLMALTVWEALSFPVAGIALSGGLFIYFAVLTRYQLSWLIVVPALLPVLYLAPWSGRILWDCYDLLLMATLAGALWHGYYRGSNTRKRQYVPIFAALMLFSLSWLLSLSIGLFPLDPYDANALSNYHSSYNALRIGKSLLWALLLLLPVHRCWNHDPELANRYLTTGASLGLLFLGVIVLAERGVFHAVTQAQNIYGLVGPLLDFSTTYRVTGLFADMHTGGAAIDAYLLLTLPFALYGAISNKTVALRVVCIIACVLGLYSLLVTFSRTTYIAMLLSFGIFAAGYYLKVGTGKISHPLLRLVVIPLCLLALYLFLFAKGGTVSLIAGAGTGAVGMLAPGLRARFGKLAVTFLIGCTALFALVISCYGMATSKWVDNKLAEVLLYSLLGVSIAILITHYLAAGLTAVANLKQTVILTAVITLGSVLTIPSLFGTRMVERFSVIDTDISTRASHTLTSLGLMEHKLPTQLFGEGLGSFPRYYAQLTDLHAGSFAYIEEPGSTYLRIGGDDDFKVGQRFAYRSDSPKMTVRFDAKMDVPGAFYVVIARKMINNQLGYNPQWSSQKVRIETANLWQTYTLELDIGKFADRYRIGSRPLALLFINQRKGTLVDIDNVSLTDQTGRSLLQNGDFESGGDHWFFYNDIKHLPWHTKNLWVHLYFELGLLGLLTFMIWIALVFNQLLRHLAQMPLAIPITAAMTGFLILGVSDGLLDTPRTFFLFFLLTVIATKLLPQTTHREL